MYFKPQTPYEVMTEAQIREWLIENVDKPRRGKASNEVKEGVTYAALGKLMGCGPNMVRCYATRNRPIQKNRIMLLSKLIAMIENGQITWEIEHVRLFYYRKHAVFHEKPTKTTHRYGFEFTKNGPKLKPLPPRQPVMMMKNPLEGLKI